MATRTTNPLNDTAVFLTDLRPHLIKVKATFVQQYLIKQPHEQLILKKNRGNHKES